MSLIPLKLLFLTAIFIVGACATRPPSKPENRLAVLEFSAPAPGAEVEFDRWYEQKHLPEMRDKPGFRSAERFVTIKADTPTSTLPPYLVIYQLDSAGNSSKMRQRLYEHKVAQDPSFNPASSQTLTYRPLGDLVYARNVPGATPPTPVPGQTQLKTYALMVLTDPVPGEELAYNTWYDSQHVPDVLRIPGFLSGQRYIIQSLRPSDAMLPRYMVLFMFQSFDLEGTIADLKRRHQTGQTRMSSALDNHGTQVYYFLALGQFGGDR